MPLRELEKRAALQILAFLLKKKEASRTDLRENIKATLDAIYSSLPILKDFNLITEDEQKEFPFAVTILLTDKGRRVAEKLVEIEQILEE